MIDRVRTLRRMVLPVVTVAALVVTGCSSGPDQPETVAEQFAEALEQGDAQAAAELTTDPAGAAAAIGDLFEGLGSASPEVTLGGTGDGNTFDLDVVWRLGPEPTAEPDGATPPETSEAPEGSAGEWSYRTSGSAVEGEAGWLIRWDPAVLAPGLTADTSLRYLRTEGEPASVLDRNGLPLMEQQVVTLVNLDATADPAAVAPVLATVVPSITTESLAADLAKAGTAPVTAVTLRDEDLASVEAQLTALPGVSLVAQTRLLTVDRELASPVWSGLAELWQDGQDASAGWAVQSVNADGSAKRVTGVDGTDPPDVRTTVDLGLQARAEAAVAPVSQPAVVVAVEPSTGAVRAVAQNAAADAEGAVALTGLYPPGSTFKTVTTSAALQAGAADPDTVLPCPGVATIEDRTIPNDDSFDLGPVPLHTAFAHSCNTTMAQLAVNLPADALSDAAAQFGLGIDYVTPGLVTVTGSVPVAESPAQRVESAIGQGTVTASPFGMAMVAASIVRGSTPAPMIVQGEPATADRTVDAAPVAATTALRTMMRETVTDGTATALRDIPELIGKTGTAEYGDNSEAHGWFIAAQNDLAFAVFVAGAGSSAPAVEVAGRMLRG
ncbi:penicillin-binding transpeptidase domain-containing protein [Rhodococcus phenolicus]|uniref:penicillin-binding transpeptidase domain-containing protein n=1 Tax=Rhodococcus phenolicus TaxID=263849 RepID=UPI0008352A68|nr:penicillin-binding transpeptidase domain-containing protein [Rhodococcus phenolicus]